MPVSDQLHALLPAVATLEKSLAEQSSANAGLSARVATLTAENAALRKRLDAVTPPVTGNDPNPVPPPVVPTLTTQWGFVANDTDPLPGVVSALARMKADGGAWLRLWHSSFDRLSAGTVRLIDAAAGAGVNVILCVQPKDTEARPLGTPDVAGFVGRNAATLKKLAYLEAGNELNLNQYRPDDLGGGDDWHRPYVDRFLRPVSAAMRGLGVKTLCTSVTDSYHPQTYAAHYDKLRAAGAADCCDGLAVHAYFLPQHLQLLADLLKDLNAVWAKPIHVTECNVLTKNLTAVTWQKQFGPYLKVLRGANVAGVQFYRGFARAAGKWSWPVLFDNAGKPTEAYAVLRGAITA